MTATGPFDPFAAAYDAWLATPLGRTVDEVEKDLLAQFAGEVPGQRALDVGTGTGHFAQFLAGRGACAVGVDISRPMLRVASAKKHMPPLVQADAGTLPFGDGSFDLVFSVTALEFVPDPVRALGEMVRVCRPGGRLVVGVLNAWSPWAWSRRRMAKRNPDDPFAAAHFYAPPEFVRLLSPFGKPAWGSSVFVLPAGQGLGRAWALERFGRRFLKPFGALLVGRVNI